jgi:hypothetical protein
MMLEFLRIWCKEMNEVRPINTIETRSVVFRDLVEFLTCGKKLVPIIPGTKTPFANRNNEISDHRIIITNTDQLDNWLKIRPDSNWGLLGMVQLDPDSPEAMAWVRDMGIKSSDPTWILRTRRGYKPIFKAPIDCPKTHNDPTHKVADLGGPKTLIIIPPSIHPSGFKYQWVPGHSPQDIPFDRLSEPPQIVMDYWKNVTSPTLSARTCKCNTPKYLMTIYDAIVAKLEMKGLRLRPTHDGGLQGDCPFHHSQGRKAFVIHPEKGAWCFAGCLENGRLTNLALRLGITEIR